MNAVGLGEGSETPAQELLARLGQPLHNAFRMQQRVGIFTRSDLEVEPNWEAYAQVYRGTSTELYEEAGRILGSILGMTPEQREQAWLTFEPGAPGDREELQDLIRYALAARTSFGAAEFSVSRIPYFEQQWLRQQASGQPATFLDYLKDTFVLDGFLEGN